MKVVLVLKGLYLIALESSDENKDARVSLRMLSHVQLKLSLILSLIIDVAVCSLFIFTFPYKPN